MPAMGSVKVPMRCRLVCVAHEASEICVAEVPGSSCFSLLQHVVLGVKDVQCGQPSRRVNYLLLILVAAGHERRGFTHVVTATTVFVDDCTVLTDHVDRAVGVVPEDRVCCAWLGAVGSQSRCNWRIREVEHLICVE